MLLLLLRWTHIPTSQLSLGIQGISLLIPDFSSWRIEDTEGKGEMTDEEKSVVLWQTPGTHSTAWHGVQAKPSWNLCIWGLELSLSKE